LSDGKPHAIDLTGLTLEDIRALADPSADLDPDSLTDRPALRQALRRIREEAAFAQQTYAGFDNQCF